MHDGADLPLNAWRVMTVQDGHGWKISRFEPGIALNSRTSSELRGASNNWAAPRPLTWMPGYDGAAAATCDELQVADPK